MFCQMCGKENPDGAKWCAYCGTRLAQPEKPTETLLGEEPAFDAAADDPGDAALSEAEAPAADAPMDGETPEEIPPLALSNAAGEPEDAETPVSPAPRRKKKGPIIAIASVAAALALAVGGAVGYSVVTGRQYDEDVLEARALLQREEYAPAVALLEQAIDRKPKKDDAYLALTDAYLAQGEIENAQTLLETGTERTKSGSIAARLDEVRAAAALLQQIKPAVTAIDTDNFPEIALDVQLGADDPADLPDGLTEHFFVREGDAELPCTVQAVGDGAYHVRYQSEETDRSLHDVPVSVGSRIEGVAFKADTSFIPPPLQTMEIAIRQVDASEYPKVKLYASVVDKETGEVPENINPGFIYLSEKLAGDPDYVKRAVKKATQLNEKESVNVNLVADVSGSMRGSALDSAKAIITDFLNSVQFGAGDQTELLAFSDYVYPVMEFTDDKQSIVSAVAGLETGDMTALYDALFAAVNRTAVQSGAKCVIAFTDGMDNQSQATPEQVIDLAKRYSVPIFIIGVGDGYDTGEIRKIASETSGGYWDADEISDLSAIYDQIYREQKALYLFEYETGSADQSDAARRIDLRVQGADVGGVCDYTYTPKLLFAADAQADGLTDVDAAISAYLTNFIKAINESNFSILAPTLVADGPLYNEQKTYVLRGDVHEQLISYEIVSKQFTDDSHCTVKARETYQIQTLKQPLHIRVFEDTYTLHKQADGSWLVYSMDELNLISKT